ncbi:suppressor of tumorigenicity 14 protein, partial [Vespula squamosa]
PPSPTGGCILPKQPDGGQYVLGGCGEPCRLKASDKVPRNSILTYSCNGNYVLSWNTITVCVNDEWYNPPTCQKTCSPLESTTVDISCTYQGENVLCNERARPGTRAKLFCKQSYNLPPTNDPVYREIVYLDYGLWDRTLFSCCQLCIYILEIFLDRRTSFFHDDYSHCQWIRYKIRLFFHGTLVSIRKQLTIVAHCFYDEGLSKMKDTSSYYVAVGKYYRSWEARENYVRKALVEKIILLDRYIGARRNFAQDIVLLKSAKSFELTALVKCLDCYNIYEKKQLRADNVGTVGVRLSTGRTENIFKRLIYPSYPTIDASKSVPNDFYDYLTDNKFCAGYLNNKLINYLNATKSFVNPT